MNSPTTHVSPVEPEAETAPNDSSLNGGTNCARFPLSLWALLAVFAVLLAAQWQNAFSIAQADGIAYITGGVNLITTGSFTNPLGELETWFPPLYPALIGLFSIGGRIDPVAVGRLICAGFSLWGLLLVWRATCLGTAGNKTTALLAVLVLASNFLYQTYAMAVMSHAPATALGLAAFVLWLRATEAASTRILILLGLCIGAAFLVRPEAVLVLPCWLLIDAFSWGWRTALRRTIYSSLACAVLVLPYVFYLHHVTGHWQLSGKGEVTLAIGRGQFYGGPRDYIDPETLQWKYQSHEVTTASELRRFGSNLSIAVGYIWQTVRGPIGGGLLLLSLLGAWRLAYTSRWRFLFGLLAQLSFLAAVVATWCSDRMLHAVWPVFAILAGVGAEYLWQNVRSSATKTGWKCVAFLWLAWAGLGWMENITRQPRWSLGGEPSSKILLRDAGLAFQKQQAEQNQPKGAMMELGATVGYYAGAYRRLFPTSNDLGTLIRYLQHRDTPYRPAWIVLYTSEARDYHVTVRQPFLADKMPLAKVFEMSQDGARVVIYEVPPPEVP